MTINLHRAFLVFAGVALVVCAWCLVVAGVLAGLALSVLVSAEVGLPPTAVFSSLVGVCLVAFIAYFYRASQ